MTPAVPPELAASPYLTRSVVDGPVGLLIVRAGTRRNATTISFFSEVAHHPTTMWVSLAASSYALELLVEARRFSFVVLHAGQARIAAACGSRSGRGTDKCAGLDLYDGGEGFLFLRGAVTSTACVLANQVPVGDHILCIARILSGVVDSRRTTTRHLLVSDLLGE